LHLYNMCCIVMHDILLEYLRVLSAVPEGVVMQYSFVA